MMLHLLLTRGLAVVFAASFIESLGAPVPAFPLLLLAGSVAAEYRFSAVPLVVASACGFWVGDLIWYSVGRIQGRRVLGMLCRAPADPGSAQRNTRSDPQPRSRTRSQPRAAPRKTDTRRRRSPRAIAKGTPAPARRG